MKRIERCRKRTRTTFKNNYNICERFKKKAAILDDTL